MTSERLNGKDFGHRARGNNQNSQNEDHVPRQAFKTRIDFLAQVAFLVLKNKEAG